MRSLYYTHVKPRLDEIQQLASVGATHSQIAAFLGISVQAHYKYMAKYVEYGEAVTRAREAADDLVESALHRAALGFEAEETSETSTAATDRKSTVRRTVTRKTIPPNPQAAVAWLRVHRPDVWNIVNNVNLSGNVKAQLTPEEKSV